MVEKRQVVSTASARTFPYWFPVFRWMAVHLPPDGLGALAAATIERFMWARTPVREAVRDNVSRVLGVPRLDDAVEATARRMFSRHSRLWIDLLRYSARTDFSARDLVARSSGEERLVAARDAGKGGILLTAHVGNFELGGLFLRDLAVDVYAVYAPDPSPEVEAHRDEARRAIGVKGIPVTTSPFAFVPMLRALRAGSFLAMQGDRDYSGTGDCVPFLGELASFPTGPFRLAQVSGAPLFPVFILQEDDGRYRIVVHEPIPVRTGGSEAEKAAAVHEALAAFVAILERTIRENPSQWYLFHRFWD